MTRIFILLLTLLYAACPSHLPGAVIYVKATATGTVTNGLSWDTAFQKIQSGINAAEPGDELWVAAGTYSEHLTLKDGVRLFGGFDGIATHPSQRNWNIHKSIIDGSGSGRVISVDACIDALAARVDGFIIKNGSNDFGSGIYSAGGNLIFANNLVVANRANGPFSGAGVFVDESATFPSQPLHTLFTTISDRLLSEHSPDLNSSHIPLFPTNRYTPEVHRLLQVAANIVDATTNRGASYPYYPSVFRPVFTNDNGAIAISGYVEAEDAQFISNTWLDLKISQDRSLLTSDEVRSNANLYGQAIIIGAKKGFPNFNEFSMETVAQVVRRIELRKGGTHPLLPPNETNQMYSLGITNYFGVEAWNSYLQEFPRPVELLVRHTFSAGLTNHMGLRLTNRSFTITQDPMTVTNWSSVMLSNSPSTAAFKIPFHASFDTLPASQFVATPPHFAPITNLTFQRFTGFPIPGWFLNLTNRLQYFALDNGKVIDFVNLDDLVMRIDLTRELLSAPYNPYSYPYEDRLMSALWSTNRANDSLATEGILNQIDGSLGEILPGNYWRDYAITRQDITIEKQIDEFRFFMGLSPIYGNTTLTPTNRMQVPFSPIRTFYQKATWQANDPIVHHQVHDLVDRSSLTLRMIVPPKRSYTQFSESNLGQWNDRLNPYFSNPHLGNPNNPFWRNSNHIRDGALQDTNIRWPQDWDFPSDPMFNLSWLDRIHRGTPWQTLFTGNSHHSTSDWQKWSGSSETHPTNDWSVIYNLLANKSALGSTAVSEWTPGVVNNTFAKNTSPFPGAGVTLFSPAYFANNIVANNDSGVALLGATPELSPGKNLVSANRSDDLTGISPGEWNIAADPQFVSAGNFHLRATSPAIDAGTEDVYGMGLLLQEPARSQGARLDLGAYELSATDAPVLAFSNSTHNPDLHSLRVIGFTGEAYVVEQSTDLANWTPVVTNTTANGSFEHLDSPTNPQRFYRAIRLPH